MRSFHSLSKLGSVTVLLVIPFISGALASYTLNTNNRHRDILVKRGSVTATTISASKTSSISTSSTGALILKEEATTTSALTSSRSNMTYDLQDIYVGSSFLTGFTFETFASGDPTHGRVNYVNQSYALEKGLATAWGSTFTMRVDHTTMLSSSGPGRDSVRIKSVKQYETHLAVFDIAHMPQGCATWPALWENDDTDWPNSGEVDIIEGVNNQSANQMTLHTTANCTMSASSSTRDQTGSVLSTDCYWETNYNEGCGVSSNKVSSFGPNFNANGGGWYVLERSTDGLWVWFWSRQDPSVPWAVKSSFTRSLSSASFGTPLASFPSTSTCSIPSHFSKNNIIFDLTLCGDWAGNADVYEQSGCPGTCVDYVNNNPSEFADAYWTVNGVRVYT